MEVSPWEIMVQSMQDVGFAINAVWPMRSEAYSEKADGTRILIVARKMDKSEMATRRGFITTLKRELPEKLEKAFCAGIDGCDREIVAIGCGLSYSQGLNKLLMRMVQIWLFMMRCNSFIRKYGI